MIIFAKYYIQLKIIVHNMARPIRETPILTGKDAERFMQRMEQVESRNKEEREAIRKKFQERVEKAKKMITFCW